MPPPPSLRVAATYNAPAVPAVGFALPDVGDSLFTLERVDERVRLVERDTATFAERASWETADPRIPHWRGVLGVSPDRSTVVVQPPPVAPLDATFHSLDGGEPWVVPQAGYFNSLQWSRDGRTVLLSGADAVWIDVASRRIVDRATRQQEHYSPDTRSRLIRLASRRGVDRLAVVERDGMRELASWALPAKASRRWLPADDSLESLWCALSDGERHEIRLYSLRTNDVPFAVIGEPWLGVFARGDEAAVVANSGRVARVAREGGALALRWLPPSKVPLPFAPSSVKASSTDGRRVVVSLGRRFAVVDLDTGESRAPATLTAGATGRIAASPDGRRVAVANDGGEVAVLDAADLSPEVTFEVDAPARGVVFAPDGRTLHAWSDTAWTTLDPRDASTHVAAELPRQRGAVGASYGGGDLSPDGRFGALALDATPEGEAVWLRVDLARGAAEWMGTRVDGDLHGLRYSADGRFVVGFRGGLKRFSSHAASRVRCDAATGALVDERPFLSPADLATPESLQPLVLVALGPRGEFAILLRESAVARRYVSAVRAPGIAAAAAAWRHFEVLGSSRTSVICFLFEPPSPPRVSVLEVDTLAELASARWPWDDAPRGACFVADDALVVVCGDGRVVRLEVDAAP